MGQFFGLRRASGNKFNTAPVAYYSVAPAISQKNFVLFAASGKNNSGLSWSYNLDPDHGGPDSPNPSGNPNRRVGIVIAAIAILAVFVSVFGIAVYRAGRISDSTAQIAGSQTQVTCQDLIDRAIQASGDSCVHLGANQVCYGNNTLIAELNNGGQFTRRGDVIGVDQLKRLAASPLSLLSEEWGIAVFKIMANLPRSLPGETITMIVFGNTTLDNSSNNLQTFYFSSTLGQIDCEQVPFDGLMITMPDGAGVRFVINGAEMVLTGNASMKATQNGQMEVSMLSGSAIVSSNGGSQLIVAGESTSMDLGGPDGNTVISPPSAPQPLAPEELTLACTLTGSFCSLEEIIPVDLNDALVTLQELLGISPAADDSAANLPTSIASLVPTGTLAASQMLPGTSPLPQNQPASFTATFIASTFTIPSQTIPPPTETSIPPTATNPPPTPIPMITICHCSEPDKCNSITVTNTGSGGHWNHPYDIIPEPAGGCPQPPPEPTATTP